MLRRIPRPRADICLRCSIRLSQQNARPLFPSIARYFSDRKEGASDDAPQEDTSSASRPSEQHFERSLRGPFRPERRLDLRPKNKRRRAGNRLLTEDSAALGMDMLGKPARAVLLRDGGLYVKRDTTQKYEPEPTSTSPDWMAMFESHQDDVTTAEVFDNIESHKPESDRLLSERAFRKLQATLFDGFTAPQLQGYLQWCSKQSPDENSPQSMAMRLPWVHSITDWIPLAHTSEAPGKGEPHLQGYISSSSSPKERLVIRVLREAWRLSISELSTGLGEVRVRLRNTEFTLLMRGTQRFMNLLGKQWLEPGEKIESSNGTKTLRFVIKKPKADILLAELDKTLNCIETKTLPLSLLTTEPLSDALMEELGRITNTHIRQSASGRRIHITWIEVRSLESKSPLEDLRHVVFRLLLTALAPARVATSLSSDLPAKATGRFIPDRTSTSKWAWKDRMDVWERYVAPAPSVEPTSGTERSATIQQERTLPALDLPFDPMSQTPTNEESRVTSFDTALSPVSWAATARTSTTAHFGHLLHAATTTSEKAAPETSTTVADIAAAGRRRIFSPLIPHPTRLAELETRDSDAHQVSSGIYPAQSTILLRFQPSPRTASSAEDEYITPDPRAGQSKVEKRVDKSEKRKESSVKGYTVWPMAPPPTGPILELRLAIQDTEVLGIQSLRAIKHKAFSDVMLPGSLIDMRFTQIQYAELQGGADAMAAWPPLANFLGKARFDLDRGKVDMPPRQKFPIPRGLFADFDGDKSDPSELVSTQYEFVGLELHRAVSMPHKGYTMTYTSVEAGQGGGRRAELSLEAAAMPSPLRFSARPTPDQAEGSAQQEASNTTPASESIPEQTSGVTPPPPSTVPKKDFVTICYEFARDESMWAGYPGEYRQ
ncbi:mitochondrial inner-membrane-bound regulator-domain-containing protein [Microdochium bolleyi]|uniref:Mitochondrial inner-membrane-bound regulator-domain-containing protein n=1 Tax=Microdochium bolleyi TaxID=196109 RepID=A0A136JAJ5_9PEZI|nr:mitochondrial inner-membrane-bound regulator-domain-containing protein [Microdochium bolleyi]